MGGFRAGDSLLDRALGKATQPIQNKDFDADLAWLKNFYERHKHREETLKTAHEWGIDPGLISPELASDVKDGGDLAQ